MVDFIPYICTDRSWLEWQRNC